MAEFHPPTLAAAQARIAAVRPTTYAFSRNATDGAVSGLQSTADLLAVNEVPAW